MMAVSLRHVPTLNLCHSIVNFDQPVGWSTLPLKGTVYSDVRDIALLNSINYILLSPPLYTHSLTPSPTTTTSDSIEQGISINSKLRDKIRSKTVKTHRA